MKVLQGSSRLVILTKNWAFKIPFTFYKSLGYRGFWYRLLTGLKCNIQEREFSGMEWSGVEGATFPYRCARVHFYIPGGWLVVMRRGRDLDLKDWINLYEKHPKFGDEAMFWPDIIEWKSDSFKFIDNEIQVVDFGS